MPIPNSGLLDLDSDHHADDPGELQLGILKDMIGYQLRRAQLRVQHNFAKRLEHTNVTPGQLSLLVKIKNNPGISQTALARANGIERSTLGEIIDRFEQNRWVDRRKHMSDRRAHALHLSPVGESFVNAIIPVALTHEAELTASWSKDEKTTLLRLLDKLAD
ncbi:MAG: MarR family transcriptional regulator [Cellvibrionaceae bacterium]